MPHPLSHKYPIPISQLSLVNTDVPGGVGAPPLDATSPETATYFVASIHPWAKMIRMQSELVQSEHIHNRSAYIITQYFRSLPAGSDPCLKTIKWTSSCSLENIYRHRYPKREKIYWDRDLIDRNQTEWYMHKVKSQSFSLLIFTHTQSEISSHLKEETIEGRNLR